jgi:micrococcal nuclease
LSLSATAKNYGTAEVSKVISVYDGDTFRANIKGYPPLVGENISIRINAIDTAEIRGKCPREKELAIKAREFTKSHFAKAKIIEFRNIKRGKYFRLAADIYVDNQNLGDLLISAGLAYRYNKRAKKSWCN